MRFDKKHHLGQCLAIQVPAGFSRPAESGSSLLKPVRPSPKKLDYHSNPGQGLTHPRCRLVSSLLLIGGFSCVLKKTPISWWFSLRFEKKHHFRGGFSCDLGKKHHLGQSLAFRQIKTGPLHEAASLFLSAAGFEPTTLSSGGTRDIQLRYAPARKNIAQSRGFYKEAGR